MNDSDNKNGEIIRKRGRPKGAKDKVPRKPTRSIDMVIEPGGNSRIVAFNTRWLDYEKVDITVREQVEKRIREYFEACIEEDMRPGVAGMCVALGIDRTTFYVWKRDNRHGYRDIVERARGILESVVEQYTLQGKLNPVSAIFYMKAHFGYTDVNQIVLTSGENALGEQVSAKTLEKKYLEQTVGILDSGETAEEKMKVLIDKYKLDDDEGGSGDE